MRSFTTLVGKVERTTVRDGLGRVFSLLLLKMERSFLNLKMISHAIQRKQKTSAKEDIQWVLWSEQNPAEL